MNPPSAKVCFLGRCVFYLCRRDSLEALPSVPLLLALLLSLSEDGFSGNVLVELREVFRLAELVVLELLEVLLLLGDDRRLREPVFRVKRLIGWGRIEPTP